MKYLITVLLSALFAALIGQAPALKNSAVHNAPRVKPTVNTVTTTSAVQPQPEIQTVAATQPAETYAKGCSTYDSIFRQYAWNVRVAEAICQAESGGNPYAVSNPRLNFDGVSDFGLMQIHGEDILNPSANIARAHQKYVSQGWNAWTTYSSGAYLMFL
jgi:soluble lytic murein transglycosylase-like protein